MLRYLYKKLAIKLGIELPKRREINSKETFNKGSGKVRYCLNCGKVLSNRQTKYCNNICQADHRYK